MIYNFKLNSIESILVGLLIFNLFLYKYLNDRNQVSTITYKFVIGMCFASLSMCVSGLVEIFRQQKCNDGNFHIFFSLLYLSFDILIYMMKIYNVLVCRSSIKFLKIFFLVFRNYSFLLQAMNMLI